MCGHLSPASRAYRGTRPYRDCHTTITARVTEYPLAGTYSDRSLAVVIDQRSITVVVPVTLRRRLP
jgi:hypothetical protein